MAVNTVSFDVTLLLQLFQEAFTFLVPFLLLSISTSSPKGLVIPKAKTVQVKKHSFSRPFTSAVALFLGYQFLYINLLSEPKGIQVAPGHKQKSPFLVELMVLKELESCWEVDPSLQIVLQNFAVSSSATEFFAAFSLIWQEQGHINISFNGYRLPRPLF